MSSPDVTNIKYHIGRQRCQDTQSCQPIQCRRDASHSVEQYSGYPIRQYVYATSTTNLRRLNHFCNLAHLSVGAQADSAHEYLLKQYLLTAKTDRKSLEMCKCCSSFPRFFPAQAKIMPDIRTTTHILTNLFYLSPTRHFLYVTGECLTRTSDILDLSGGLSVSRP
jgi:hypothetical protein